MYVLINLCIYSNYLLMIHNKSKNDTYRVYLFQLLEKVIMKLKFYI